MKREITKLIGEIDDVEITGQRFEPDTGIGEPFGTVDISVGDVVLTLQFDDLGRWYKFCRAHNIEILPI
ncbi:MAG: hypothetical protein RBS36_11600 [Thiomicrospira sp.]|jgi:hypothetical protein|nr:hypothetical protein [Thiomicrospira sp.]